jgi:hypothetical protein
MGHMWFPTACKLRCSEDEKVTTHSIPKSFPRVFLPHAAVWTATFRPKYFLLFPKGHRFEHKGTKYASKHAGMEEIIGR